MSLYTNNILLTGYWPPTNHMLRQFSTDERLNPEGWKGRNWRNHGFDIFSYFPEFDPSLELTDSPGQGEGDFQVNYRKTLQDFTRLTDKHQPCAIVVFSRGERHKDWEVEAGARNWGRDRWRADFEGGRPNPAPPDTSQPPDSWRSTTLPHAEIIARVNRETGIDAQFDPTNSVGRFLSEYIGYLALKYQAEHRDSNEPFMCAVAGHIHVSKSVPLDEATLATEITLEEVMKAARSRLPRFWLAEVGVGIKTKESPNAGTDDPVDISILRDGAQFGGVLSIVRDNKLEPGNYEFYTRRLPGPYRDRGRYGPFRRTISRIADRLWLILRRIPGFGVEYANGLEGHFECQLSIAGNDTWVKEQVDLYVKEAKLNHFGIWVVNPEWIYLGSCTQDVSFSTNPEDGFQSVRFKL